MSKARSISITHEEFDAIVDAAALHEVQYQDDDGTERTRHTDAALTRVIRKWQSADESVEG